MTDYQLHYTGEQIDTNLGKASTAVQPADLNSKQDTLVSGTNIKTINNTSLLGSGNITIEGGGASTDVQINGTSIVSSGTANIATEGTYDASTNKIATMKDIIYEANVTLAQDYSKMYFTPDDLYYLQHNEPLMLKGIWDDGEGHQGAFVMTLTTTQESGTASMPRIYTATVVDGGLNIVSVKIDSAYTVSTGCPLEMYTPNA